MKTLQVFLVAALLGGCTLPQTTVHTGSAQPGLIVKGAPAGAVLYVDGLQAGAASQYDGNPRVLAVLEGTHKVEVRVGATSVFSDKIFVGNGETHTVTVVSGASQ